jgi:hypothetical protein
MDEDGFLKIVISKNSGKGNEKSPKNVQLDDHVEVNMRYLYLLKNVWLKYKDIETGEVFSGGVLIDEDEETYTLRNIQQKTTNLQKKDTVVYCKSSNPIYSTIKNIILERQKLHIERVRLNNEKQRLERLAKKLNNELS